MSVYVLYENEDWMPPLRVALDKLEIHYEEIFMDGGTIDMATPPNPGIYINRMSPSSHTRGHQAGVHFAREYIAFLESHGCRVINGSHTFRLELSKIQQYSALQAAGIKTPHTIAVAGTSTMQEASRQMAAPFITKHNQGGKGLGVQLFRDHSGFTKFIQSGAFEDSPDDINLLQEYIEPAEQFITRVEIVDGKFLYALRSSTEDGFELCPADACSIGDQFCPAPGSEGSKTDKFQVRQDIDENDSLVQAYLLFCRNHQIDIAGIEFVEDSKGNRYTYDINCTSNYNGNVEDQAKIYGMDAIAALCKRELDKLNPAAHSIAA